MFSPLAFPAGSVLFDLSTSAPLPSHALLHPYELHREPLVIVGVADGLGCCTESGDHSTVNAEPQNSLSGHEDPNRRHQLLSEGLEGVKSAYPRALVHQVLIFDHERPIVALPTGISAVPSRTTSKLTTMKTIMCDLTAQLLGEMTTYAKSLQALPTIESPTVALGRFAINGAESLNTAPPTSAVQGSRPGSPMKNETKSQHRMSTPVSLPSESSSKTVAILRDGARSPPSRVASPATTFDEIAGSRRLASPSQNVGSDNRQQSKERLSTQGFGSGGVGERERMKGKARIGAVIGAMYLLAGRWPDAIRELVESASISKANSDYIWIAKALDYILVTLLMYAWAGMDFKVRRHFQKSHKLETVFLRCRELNHIRYHRFFTQQPTRRALAVLRAQTIIIRTAPAISQLAHQAGWYPCKTSRTLFLNW